MKILLTGKDGQVGWELNRSLLHLGHIFALDRHQADLSKPDEVRKKLNEIRPDVIVNAAAYTAVDKAEAEDSVAMTINGIAPGVLAEEARKLNALFVHYSTDYVFDGEKEDAYTESDVPSPVNVYGRTKLAGEQFIQESGSDYLIFRTSWVYAARGKNFLLTMMRLAQERESISIVRDQFGSPVWARLIAETTAHCISQALPQRRSGNFDSQLFHLASAGSTSWHGFADAIMRIASERLALKSRVRKINAIPTSEYPTPARRPKNSRLASRKLESSFDVVMPHWRECLELCIEGMK